MTALRGLVRSGNSGGPMVDGDGPRRHDDLRRHDERRARRLRRPQRRRRARPRRRPAARCRPGPAPAIQAERYPRAAMGKTLVIAEKPSVGRDLARVLPGAFQKHEGYLETDEHVMTWAVGHLVQLAEPDEYDAKFKKWRMADLPIVPDAFKLVVRDERSKKQMSVITKLLARADVERVVNACDAGREGELIFAWTYEKAKARKPVERLWLSSMTTGGDQERAGRPAAARRLRAPGGGGALALRGRLDRRHERHARGDDPAALLVRRRRLAGPRPDADAGADRAPRGGDPRVQAGGVLAGRRDLRARRRRARPPLCGPLPRRRPAAAEERRRGRGDRRRGAWPGGRDHEAGEVDQEGARPAPLRPHDAPARGQQPLRLLGPAHARRRAAALRGAQGAHLPAHELALPHGRHGRGDQADGRAGRPAARVRPRRGLRDRARHAAARPRRQRREGHRPPRDHPDQGRA